MCSVWRILWFLPSGMTTESGPEKQACNTPLWTNDGFDGFGCFDGFGVATHTPRSNPPFSTAMGRTTEIEVGDRIWCSLFYLFFCSLSLSLYIYISLSLSLSPLSLSIYIYFFFFFSLSLSLSPSLPRSLSLSLSPCKSLLASIDCCHLLWWCGTAGFWPALPFSVCQASRSFFAWQGSWEVWGC